MNRALFSGLSGTIAFQNRLDVVGNNIANSNTIAYKQARATFRDALYQTLRGGSSGSETGLGGTNPIQIGSGVSLGAIAVEHTQGSLERTGQPLDAAIEGPGMFVISDGNATFYTRDGAFGLDNNNTLVHAGTGYRVQGWVAADGIVSPTGPPSDLHFDISQLAPPRATSAVAVTGNLSANASPGDTVQTTIAVYDSLGATHQMTVTFTRGAHAGEWDVQVACEGDTENTTITFAANGALTGSESVTIDLTPDNGATSPQAVQVALGVLTGLAEPSSVAISHQDGRPAASLVAVELTDGGYVLGRYSDGRNDILGQLALASFTNPGGLSRTGANLYAPAPASGPAAVGSPGTGGRGHVVAQALEMSNVDLTKAFVDMITTQRGFQASTRVIATANELLDDVVRLIRT